MLICVTGIKGSGKTTAMKMIKKSGQKVFITDQWIRSIYKAGKCGYKLIEKNFGKSYVTKTSVNRGKLGQLVFNDPSELKKLNEIMLPIIYKKILGLKSRNYDVFVELAIYMNHEKTFKNLFEKVILIKRKQKVEKNNKNPIKNKKIFYHILLENIGDFDDLKIQLSKKLFSK